MSARPFQGPVIDRDVFSDVAGHLQLPERLSASEPYFYVIRDNDPMRKWRFLFDFKRGGWVWDTKYRQ